MTAPMLPDVSCEFCRQPLHPGPCAGWKAAKAAGRDHTITHHDLVPARARRRDRAGNIPGPDAHPEVKLAYARDRQARIDHARNRADVLAELEERVIINDAEPDLAKRIFDQYTRMRGVQDDPDIRKVGAALATGDPATLDKALAAVAKKLGLERIGGRRGSAAQLVGFDPHEQRPLGKIGAAGTPAFLVRPGYAKVVDGDRLVIVKAVVEKPTPEEIAAHGNQLASLPDIAGMHEFCRNPLHPGPCAGWKAAKVAGRDHTIRHVDLAPAPRRAAAPAPKRAPAPVPAAAPGKRARKAKPLPAHRVSEKELLAAHGGEKESRQLSTGDNASKVYLVTMNDGAKAVVKRSKSDRETAKHEYDAEQLGAQVGELLGLKPPKVLRTKDGEAYFDYVATGTLAAAHPDVGGADGGWSNNMGTGPFHDTPDGRRIGLLDTLIENPDRHNGNWFVQDDGSLTPIDHGLGWAAYEDPDLFPPDRPVTIGGFADHYLSGTGFEGKWVDNDLSPAYAAQLRDKLAELKPMFDDLGRTDLFDRMMVRMGIIADHAKGTVTL